MDAFQVAGEIQDRISKLSQCRQRIRETVQKRAETLAAYSKAVASAEIRLRMGEAVSVDDQTIKSPPATMIRDVAKGHCWKEEAAMLEAEGMYKALFDSMRSIQAEMNALQSVFRHLESI